MRGCRCSQARVGCADRRRRQRAASAIRVICGTCANGASRLRHARPTLQLQLHFQMRLRKLNERSFSNQEAVVSKPIPAINPYRAAAFGRLLLRSAAGSKRPSAFGKTTGVAGLIVDL